MTTLAYSHTLVAGTPENINDVQDMFNDARTVINGNLDTTNLSTSAKPVTLMGAYRTVSQATMKLTSANGAFTYYATVDGFSSVLGGTSGTIEAFPLTLADYAVSGLTTQFRVQVSTLTNTVAPAVNFTYEVGLVSTLAGGSGNIGISAVSLGGGTVTRSAPAASSSFVDSTSDFTLNASGVYVLLVALSGAPAANSNTQCTLRLQVHHI